MLVALDTNILVYAEGYGDAERCSVARRLTETLPQSGAAIPVQVLGELAAVLNRKARLPRAEVRMRVEMWQAAFLPLETSPESLAEALVLLAEHDLPIWDALILSVCAAHKVDRLYSEDFSHGFNWRSVTVLNPFNRDSA